MKFDNRTMPESVAGEAAVLGSMLIDTESIPKVIEIIGDNPQAFYHLENRLIYEAIIHLYEKFAYPNKNVSRPVEFKVTIQKLVAELESKNRLELVGGVNYIAQLTRAAN